MPSDMAGVNDLPEAIAMWTLIRAAARNLADMDLKGQLAYVRRVEDQQQTTINWLNTRIRSCWRRPSLMSKVAIDLTAYLARHEPDKYVKDVFDFGLLEDFDHLYRYSQFLDLVAGKDPNEILQGKTDVFPRRPTQDNHNDPLLRLRKHYEKNQASPVSKAHILNLPFRRNGVSREYIPRLDLKI